MNKEFSNKMAATGKKVFMIITGGGMTAATESTRHGGASGWFIGACLPYATELSREYVWRGPLVSMSAAMSFAYQADNIHRGLSEANNVMMAVCTAKLKYDGEREGREHCAFVAFTRPGFEICYKVALPADMERVEQEALLGTTFCLLMLHHAREDNPYSDLAGVQVAVPR